MALDVSALVRDYLRLLGMAESAASPDCVAVGGTCVIFAPHPDDECIMGVLPLRLQREAGMKVAVVPVTLGSKPERRAARRQELADACAVLGFEIHDAAPHGFERIRTETRETETITWRGIVAKTAALLERLRPALVVLPHRQDVHDTHVGTHHLVMDALAQTAGDFAVRLAFAEYYRAQEDPNLLVECHVVDAVRLVEAFQRHAGEVARNPYHLRFIPWLIDNARRGEELLGGLGAEAGKIPFAALYQIGVWRDGTYTMTAADRIVPATHSVASILDV